MCIAEINTISMSNAVTESLVHLNIQILTTNLSKNKLEISGKHQIY